MTDQNLGDRKYLAFISYRHADNKSEGRKWATWLHQAIETYEVPSDLVGTVNEYGIEIPTRIYPIFRDEDELPADADLSTAITTALDQSQLLIVLCSPGCVASNFVADEIDYFKRSGMSHRIVAAIIEGEPNCSWDNGKQALGFTKDQECFPLPLQFIYDTSGNPTDERAEPIGADFRIDDEGHSREGWTSLEAYKQELVDLNQLTDDQVDEKVKAYGAQQHLMLLKIIASVLGVPLPELTQREKEYQLELERSRTKKLRRWLALVASLAIIAISAGTFAYIKQQEAETMLTRVNENLNFMNYDLRDTLKTYVPSSHQVKLIERIDSLVDLLQEYGGETETELREIAVTYLGKADVILLSTDLDPVKALPLLKKAHRILQRIATDDPGNTRYSRI